MFTASQRRDLLNADNYIGYEQEALESIFKEIKASEYEEKHGVRETSIFLQPNPNNDSEIRVDEDDDYNEPEDIAVLSENSLAGFFERFEQLAIYNTRSFTQKAKLYNEDYDAFFKEEESHNIEAIADRNAEIAFERRYHGIKEICLDDHNRPRNPNRKLETKPRRKSKRIIRKA
jgi:hypothetical protein